MKAKLCAEALAVALGAIVIRPAGGHSSIVRRPPIIMSAIIFEGQGAGLTGA